MAARLCFNLPDDSPSLAVCRSQIHSQVTKLCPSLAEGDDIVTYVVFLVNKSRKNKGEMKQSLEALFEEKTGEMIEWLWSDLKEALPKPRKDPKKPHQSPKDDPEAPAETPEKRRRCRYWPNCSKEDCPFFHPVSECPHFPGCKFGGKCLMIHPDCKFGANCRNPNCAFTHRNDSKASLPRRAER
jgi:hypothetical protein